MIPVDFATFNYMVWSTKCDASGYYNNHERTVVVIDKSFFVHLIDLEVSEDTTSKGAYPTSNVNKQCQYQCQKIPLNIIDRIFISIYHFTKKF